MQHTRVSARRALRRTQRQHTAALQSQALAYDADYSDYELAFDWEEAAAIGETMAVTWRMLNNPFRIVPAWLRDDAEADYDLERIMWALAGEPLCGRWGVPLSVCTGIHWLVTALVQAHSDTALAWGIVYVIRCDHT